jgi:hypothetical protein
MKQILDLRPVYHRLEERIRAHVVLCWLALLLVRVTGPHRHVPAAHRAVQAPTRPVRPPDIPAPKQIIELAPASS